MYRGWNLVLALIVTLLSGESLGFLSWPFKFQAVAEQEPIIESTTYEYADSHAKRIAIIGAGAGGSSSAYHLQKYAAESDLAINVTVFERSSYIGGRSTTVNAYGNSLEPVELGASIFVDVNAILKNASREFDLHAKSSNTEEAEILGIWDGAEFVYTQKDSDWKYWDIAKMFWKYGLAPLKTQRLMKTVVGKFLQLYEAPYFPFRSLTERIEELDLKTVASVTGEQFLAQNNIEGSFTTDLIQASTRVNYGQNLNVIHGVETMVCMAIEGAMQIQGGNWQIFDNMIQSSNATVRLNHTITEISQVQDQERYNVKTITTDAIGVSHINEEPFDTIIIAAPLQYTDIKMSSDLLQHTPDEIPYVTLHVTLFTSPYGLNPAYFNLGPTEQVPTTILTTLPKNISAPTDPKDFAGPVGFFSISTLRKVINPTTLEYENLYKIFSPRPLTSEFLSSVLNSEVPIPEDLTTISPTANNTITWYYPHVWYSYPYEYPRVTFEEIQLAPGIYYTSGIESFISTMETSALMGKNVARLVVDDFLKITETNSEQVAEEIEVVNVIVEPEIGVGNDMPVVDEL
ncbi:putative prenylcysteine oxidase protein [Botrytis fragariae]|uniref:Putative prenylcysteine oxidase protein n=1 Tax=Botrytis fragariae TaxID=1964551 RepID=A0A8H6EFX9_9HELO|nr:putative prenylcysteine oxidase protein [Botrytis fragariae]KAF5870706.1 putative prenylcysteine oxidase protein [Botrytis fragariae]